MVGSKLSLEAEIARRTHNLSPVSDERPSGLDAQARRRTRDENAFVFQVQSCKNIVGRGCGSKFCGHIRLLG